MEFCPLRPPRRGALPGMRLAALRGLRCRGRRLSPARRPHNALPPALGSDRVPACQAAPCVFSASWASPASPYAALGSDGANPPDV
jgi:hypothetical protein